MKCQDCCYYYEDVQSRTGIPLTRKYCHYHHNDGYAPCEVEETYDEPEHDEYD